MIGDGRSVLRGSVLTLGLWLGGCAAPYATSRIGEPPVVSGDARGAPAGAVDASALRGEATWYGQRHHGNTTASGERFDMYAFTAAHRTLPFGTIVRVVREDTRQSVVVRITDRGPFSAGRVIDISWAAAVDLGIVERGTVDVVIEILQWPDGAR